MVGRARHRDGDQGRVAYGDDQTDNCDRRQPEAKQRKRCCTPAMGSRPPNGTGAMSASTNPYQTAPASCVRGVRADLRLDSSTAPRYVPRTPGVVTPTTDIPGYEAATRRWGGRHTGVLRPIWLSLVTTRPAPPRTVSSKERLPRATAGCGHTLPATTPGPSTAIGFGGKRYNQLTGVRPFKGA